MFASKFYFIFSKMGFSVKKCKKNVMKFNDLVIDCLSHLLIKIEFGEPGNIFIIFKIYRLI